MPPTNQGESVFPRPLSGAQVDPRPPALLSTRTALTGHSVELQPLDAARHAQSLYKAGHGSDEAMRIWDYLTYGPWPSVEAYTETLRQQSASFDPIFYAIRPLDREHACGQASIMDINAQLGSTEIGHIWFGPELQRTRAATEALHLMIRYVMDDLGYRRMQWRCNAQNAKSRAAANRLGFRFEGIFYNHMIFKGKNRDTAWYSILDDEWPEVRDIMQKWLADDNFDGSGKAKTSLGQAMQQRGPSQRPTE